MRLMQRTIEALSTRYERRGQEILELYTKPEKNKSVYWESYLIRQVK